MLCAVWPQAVSYAEGEGSCSPDWEKSIDESGLPSLIQWLSGQPHVESGCDDALVVTVVVAAKGKLDIPNT